MRCTEVAARIRRDADQLADIHHELTDALSSLLPLCETALRPRVTRAAPEPPRLPLRMLRLAEVAERLSLSRSSIWRMVKDGEFPKPRRLSSHAVAWPAFDELPPRKPRGRR
jgi:predicted DNA-binding transcriptional regulator AlpA